MSYIVDNLFEDPVAFFSEWDDSKVEVIVALELASIASFAKTAGSSLWNDYVGCRIRSWKSFIDTAARLSIEALASPDVLKCREKFIQSISSIEVSFHIVLSSFSNLYPNNNLFVFITFL